MDNSKKTGSGYIQLQCTFPDRETAELTARTLLEEKLLACAQIAGPALSFYSWQGKLEKEEEWLLLLKTRTSLFETVCERIKKNHPYDCPQLVATEITLISPDYEKWLNSSIDNI